MSAYALSRGFGSRVTRRRAGGAPAPAPAPTPTPAPISAVAGDGWQATMNAPADLAFANVMVARQGFDQTGTAVTVAETLATTKRVRQPFPNQASLTADRVALSDYVYASDAIAGVTNGSAELSPRPVAGWSIVDRRVVGNSLYLEIVGFHRNGVACVEFAATDGTTTVTAKTATPVVSGQAGDAGAVIAYAVTLDISALANNANITANAKVYPRIGGAAAVADSSASSEARGFSPRVWRKNVALAATPNLVHVASGGSDATGYVGPDAGLAAASPVATLNGAFSRAVTVLGAGAGALDGLRIRLAAGSWSLTANTATISVNAAVVIEPAPGVAKADAIWSHGATAVLPRVTFIQAKGISITRSGTNALFGQAGGHFTIDGCNFDNQSRAAALGGTANSGFFLTGGVTVTNWAQNQPFNAGTAEIRMLRGVSGGVANAGLTVEGWLVLGCALQGVRFVYGARATSGLIIHGNLLTRLGDAGGSTLAISSVVDNLVGAAVVQNVFEWTSATSNAALYPSGDNNPNDTAHFICWHNSFAGFDTCGRTNALYNDTAADPRSHKLASFVGNIHVQINTKHDVFISDGTRVQGWAYLYGVGCRGEFSRYLDAGNGAWKQDYPGLAANIGIVRTGVGNDPLFSSPAHTTSGPAAGAGGGNYMLSGSSPARAMVTNPPIPFDLSGAVRSGIVAAGAYI